MIKSNNSNNNKYSYVIWLLNILCIMIFNIKYIVTFTLGFLALKYAHKSYMASFLFMLVWIMTSFINATIWLLMLAFYETVANYDTVMKFKTGVDDFIKLHELQPAGNSDSSSNNKKTSMFIRAWKYVSSVCVKIRDKLTTVYKEKENNFVMRYLEKINDTLEYYFQKVASIVKTAQQDQEAQETAQQTAIVTDPKPSITNIKDLLKSGINSGMSMKPVDPTNLHDSMTNLNNMLKTVENLQKVMTDVEKIQTSSGKKNRRLKRKLKKLGK